MLQGHIYAFTGHHLILQPENVNWLPLDLTWSEEAKYLIQSFLKIELYLNIGRFHIVALKSGNVEHFSR